MKKLIETYRDGDDFAIVCWTVATDLIRNGKIKLSPSEKMTSSSNNKPSLIVLKGNSLVMYIYCCRWKNNPYE